MSLEKTLTLEEAAAFTKMSASALRVKAKSGIIVAAKPAKRWVFLESDLVIYIRSLYLVNIKVGEEQWRQKGKNFIKDPIAPHGGTGSRIQELVRKNAEAQRLAIGK